MFSFRCFKDSLALELLFNARVDVRLLLVLSTLGHDTDALLRDVRCEPSDRHSHWQLLLFNCDEHANLSFQAKRNAKFQGHVFIAEIPCLLNTPKHMESCANPVQESPYFAR